MTSNTVHIEELIDTKPIGALQWQVVALCFVLAAIDGFDAQSISYVAPILTGEFGLRPNLMGQLISAALFGLMIGAFVGSPISDRYGRKPVIISAVIIMGLFSLLTTISNSTTELFLYRFFTGLGLGALMPSINILTAEFAPARRQALLMTVMFAGFPMGTILGGVTAASLIGGYGWESVFLVGGLIPLIMAPILFYLLPESPRFLANKPERSLELARLVRRIAPELKLDEKTRFEIKRPKQRGSVSALFADGLTPVTLLLWFIFFANLLTLFAVLGWLPSVLNRSGFPLEHAILITLLFSLGGIFGGILIAFAIDRVGPTKPMLGGFLAATVAVTAVGQVTGTLPLLIGTLFLAGATAMGCQFGLNAMASKSYDTNARATGLGWALAVGRLGAIVGPIVVGAALKLDLTISTLFMLGAIPMLASAGAIYLISKITERV